MCCTTRWRPATKLTPSSPLPQVFNLKIFTFPGLACVVRRSLSLEALACLDPDTSSQRAVFFL